MASPEPRRLKLGGKPDLTGTDDTVPVAYSPKSPSDDPWPELRRPGVRVLRTERSSP